MMNKKIIAGMIVFSGVASMTAGCGIGAGISNAAKQEVSEAIQNELEKDYDMLSDAMKELDEINNSNGKNSSNNTPNSELAHVFNEGKIKVFTFSSSQEPEVLNIKDEILGQNGTLMDLDTNVLQDSGTVGEKYVYDIDVNKGILTLYNGEKKELKDIETANKLDNFVNCTNILNGTVIWYISKEANLENTKIVLKGYDTKFNKKYNLDLNDLFKETDVEIDQEQILNKCIVRGNDFKRENNSVIYISVDGENMFYPIDVAQNKLLAYKGYLTSSNKYLIDGTSGYDLQNDIYGDVTDGIIYNTDGSVKMDLSEYEFSSFDYVPSCDIYGLYHDDILFFVDGDGRKTEFSDFGPQAKSISLLKGYNKNGIIQVEYENKDGDKLYGFSNLKGDTIIEPELMESPPDAYVIGDYLSYDNNIYNVNTKKKVNEGEAFSVLGENEIEYYYESDKHVFGIASGINDGNYSEKAALVVVE